VYNIAESKYDLSKWNALNDLFGENNFCIISEKDNNG
jgi:hypothetical protein